MGAKRRQDVGAANATSSAAGSSESWMRIARLKKSAKKQSELRKELEQITRSEAGRPPVCADHCTKYEKIRCHRDCPDARFMLSSDADYPLEPKITPVVFELKRLGVYHPCWSCEGHLGLAGEIWKLPCVWFYAKSVIHVRVLADSMVELYLGGKLNVRWEVVLTVADSDNTDTSFSLQPNLKGEETTLPALHQDLENIAEHLRRMVVKRAEKLAEYTGEHQDDRETQDDRVDEKPDRGTAKLFSQLRAQGRQ